MKSKIALGAAALTIAFTTNAMSADLAKKAPAAADYVKVCDAYGAGFFYIPGSDTCLKIGGWVRFDLRTGNAGKYAAGRSMAYNGINQSDRARNGFFTRARMDLALDARTNTEFGLLRSYIDLWHQVLSSDGSAGTAGINMRSGFVQFGGLTAGRAQSFFDFVEGSTNVGAIEPDSADHRVNLLGYTQSFGNGISASIAVEDQSTTDFGIPTWAATDSAGAPYYGGVKIPDIVGNINITQSWGRAQVMAALHDDYSVANGDKWGYVVGAGAEVNLPALGKNDKFFAQAIFANGANGYAVVNAVPSAGAFVTRDFWINGGKIEQSKAWVVTSGIRHTITQTWETNLGGSYASVDQFNNGAAAGGDFKQLIVGGDLIWKPRGDFNIALAADYRDNKFSSATKTSFGSRDNGSWLGTFRVWRFF